MSDASYRGRFVWHELMTPDVPAGISFYSKVVGWKSESWDMDSSYKMLVTRSGPRAGVMDAKSIGVPPHWLTYIGTDDVDATALEAEQLGATILKAPEDIPNGGRFAVIQDPQGAAFALYRPALGSPPHVEPPPGTGEFSWHELATTDLEAGFEFYSSLFGWEKTSAMDMGELGTYQMYGWGGVPRGGMYLKPANMPAPPHWLPYAMVPDAKKAAAVIKAAGGTILNGPMEVPGGDWITMAMDPQGVAFAVHSLAATTAKSAPEKPARPAAKPAAAKKSAKPKRKAAAKKSVKPKRKAAAKPKRKPARKAAKRGAKEAARKPAKPSARRAPRKSARKPAKKTASRKRGARKSSRRPKPRARGNRR